MRTRGINYDTGFRPGGQLSRKRLDSAVVRREMQVIARDLHCTAVRITGAHPERLSVAAEHAAAAGLQVWFAPFPCELGPADLAPFMAECADRAEHLRTGGAEVVLVTGCERLDLDLASYGVVQMLGDEPGPGDGAGAAAGLEAGEGAGVGLGWAPRPVFAALARAYAPSQAAAQP